MNKMLSSALLIPAALAIAVALPAQSAVAAPSGANVRSNVHGFELGLHLNGSAIQSGGTTESGGGAGFRLGYGVSNHLSIFGEGDAANVNYSDGDGSYALAHAGLGLRGSFGSTGSALRPYVEGALMGVAAVDGDVTISGAGVQLGGGLEYFVSPHVALDAGLMAGPGALTKATVGGETQDFTRTNFTSSRFNLGVVFHF